MNFLLQIIALLIKYVFSLAEVSFLSSLGAETKELLGKGNSKPGK